MGKDKLWYEKGDISTLLRVSREKTIIFDTETTGLNPYEKDEILELSIVDGNGKILFSSYIKPDFRKTWKKAEEVNGISPSMVKNSPSFSDVFAQIQDIFSKAELIVGYNVDFDLNFVYSKGIKINQSTLLFDVMKEFAPSYNNYSEKFGKWKYCKLSVCAKRYNYKFKAHDSLEDTLATKHCFYSMLNDHETEKYTGYLKVVEIYKNAQEKRKLRDIQKKSVQTPPPIPKIDKPSKMEDKGVKKGFLDILKKQLNDSLFHSSSKSNLENNLEGTKNFDAKRKFKKYEKAILLSMFDGVQYPLNGYVTYFKYDFGINDPSILHRKYIDSGLLIRANFVQTASKCLAKELKELSEQYGIATKGKKAILIERMDLELPQDVKNNFTSFKHFYVLSQEGKKIVDQYSDYICVYRNRIDFGVSLDEYYAYKKTMEDRSMFDILWSILQKRILTTGLTNGQRAIISLNQANICLYETKHTNRNLESYVMQYELVYVFLMLNDSPNLNCLLRVGIDNPFSNKLEEEDFFAPGVIRRLEKYNQFYDNLNLDFLPKEHNMEYIICPILLFKQILNDYSKGKQNDKDYNLKINKNKKQLIKRMQRR